MNKVSKSLIVPILAIFSSLVSQGQDLLISGGNTVSTIICANGFVYTWGSNTNSQLGNGSGAANVTSPLQVNFPVDAYFTFLSEGITIRAVDAGSGAHFTALDCKGGVWSWGTNSLGQTGIGSVSAAVSTPTRVAKGESPGGAAIHASLANYLVDVKYISGGNDNSYCIMNDGRAMAWGRNNLGQLGNGTTTNSTTPVYVKVPGGAHLTGVIQIEAGDETAYALVDPDGDGIGTVYSWGAGTGTFGGTCMLGRNAAGTANSGNETGNDTYARPVLNKDGSALSGIVSISAGDILCLARDVNNYVWAWGNGGWGDCTGIGVSGVNHSDPRRVVAGEWGTTAGVGFGEPYLKAKAISGGQGYAMAVTVDGIPVAWGNNGSCAAASAGGHLGSGGGASSSTAKFIRTAAATYHSNVVSISDGDTWGFYTTADNLIYTWGSNDKGQLGLGNTTCQNYATQFSLPTCTFPAPLPFAVLKPRDMEVCASSFTSQILDCQFEISAALAADYTIEWFKDNVSVSTGNGLATTYTATSVGTYRVEVTYIGTDKPCTIYAPAVDEIEITAYVQNYTIPTPLTFCNALTPYVNGSGLYKWYKDASGGTALDTTSKTDIAALAKASVNAPVAGVYTVYVEESGEYAGQFGKVTPAACASISSQNIWNARKIVFTMSTSAVVIDTLYYYVKGETGAAQNYSWQLEIFNTKVNNGNIISDQVLHTTPAKVITNPSNGGAWVLVKIPVNYTLSGGSGTSYAIGIKNTGINAQVADFNCNYVGRTDDIATGGPYLTSTGAELNSNYSAAWGSIANVVFHTPQAFCNRVPVQLTEVCPCVKPNSVSITPAGPVNLCQGANQTLTGNVDISGLTPQTAYYYTWYKGSTAVAPASTTYADLSLNSVATTDAATYKLRVEDGNNGSSACYLEASVVVNVSATPTAGAVGSDQTICNGTAPTAFTSTSAATNFASYQWQVSTTSAVAGFSDIASATSATYAPSALSTGTYYYRRNAIAAVCPAIATTAITITVSPSITAGTVSGSATPICSGTAPAAFTETVATTGGPGSYTYQWQSATAIGGPYSDISGATSATYTSGSLTTTTYFRRVDKPASGNCPNQNTNVITITVLPGLNPGSISGTENICNGASPTVTFANVAAPSGGTSPYTKSWQMSADNSNWVAATGSLDALTFTPSGPLTDTMYYRRVVTDASGGACNTAYTNAVSINVWGAPVHGTVAPQSQNVCEGVDLVFSEIAAPTMGNPAGYTFTWEYSAVSNTGPWSTAPGSGSSATYTASNLTGGTYYFRRVETNACAVVHTGVVDVTVRDTNHVSVSIATANNPACAAQLVTFNATPVNGGAAPSYQWYVNNAPVGTNSATYTNSSLANNSQVKVVLTSNADCPIGTPATSNVVTMSIQSNVTPTVTINDPGTFCQGTVPVFVATVTGGGTTPTLMWFVNNVSTGVTTNTYSNSALADGNQVKVQLSVGSGLPCIAPGLSDPFNSNVVTMDILPVPTPQILGPDTTLCSGTSKLYGSVNGGGSLTWNRDGNALSASGSSYNASVGGVYTLTEDNGSCSATSAPVTVTVIPTPVADAGADVYVQEGTSVTLDGSGGATYLWSPATGLSSTTVANPSLTASNIITYTLTVSDASNTCFDSDQVTIWVEKPIEIPNAFTPNGDNTNDGWEIANIGGFPDCDIQVFNRWGGLVYKSTGYEEEWNGTNYRNGESLPDGTYFYIINLNSKVFTEPYSGYVQIVK